MKILFVCTGNTCRSPMAQHLANLYLPEGYEIFSAGLNAWEGDRASAGAVEAMKEKKIDLSSHKAAKLTKEMVDSAGYVFTMTKAQELYLTKLYPEHRDKIKALAYWLGSGQEIIDPWGGPREVYHCCMLELEEMVKGLREKLQNTDNLSGDRE